MNFRKPTINHHTDRPFHSSGYAQIANGGRIGSTDVTSYAMRRSVENNRRKISPYQRSILGNSRVILKLKQAKSLNFSDTNIVAPSGRQAFNVKQGLSYVEPQGRNYNPYS